MDEEKDGARSKGEAEDEEREEEIATYVRSLLSLQPWLGSGWTLVEAKALVVELLVLVLVVVSSVVDPMAEKK